MSAPPSIVQTLVDTAVQRLQDAQSGFNQIFGAERQATQRQAGTVRAAGTAESAVTAAQGAQTQEQKKLQMQHEQEMAQILARFGLDINNPNSAVANILPTLQAISLKKDKLAEQYLAVTDSSKYNGPLDALIGTVKGALINAQTRLLTRQEDAIAGSLQNLEALAGNEQVLKNAAKVTVTGTTLSADAAVTQAQVAADKVKAEVQAGVYDIASFTLLRQAQEQQISLSTQAASLAQQSENAQLQRESQSLQKQRLELDMKKQAAQDAADKQTVDRYNLAATQLGLVDPGSLLITDVSQIQQLPEDIRSTINQVSISGSLGATPSEALARGAQIIERLPVGSAYAVRQMLSIRQAEIDRVTKENATTGGNITKPKVELNVDSALTNSYAEMHANVHAQPAGVVHNLYSALPAAEVVKFGDAKGAGLADSPIGKKMLIADIKLSDQQLFDNVYAMVQAKQVSREEAAMWISKFYRSAIDLNNTTVNFKLLGLPKQQAYNSTVTYKTPAFFGITDKVTETPIFNLSDPQVVSSLILLRSAQERK